MQNDLEEFRLLIPQSGLRIKIKAAIEQFTTEQNDNFMLYSKKQEQPESWDFTTSEDDLPGTIQEENFTPDTVKISTPTARSILTTATNTTVTTPTDASQKWIDTSPCSSRVMLTNAMRLPTPCPLPTNIPADIESALTNDDKLLGVKRYRFLRQASLFYWGICPRPTQDEYLIMAVTLCDKYPKLKDKKPEKGQYWVSL